MFKIFMSILILIGLTACSPTTPEPVVELTISEIIANCVEDQLDTAEYPDDMSDMEAIDYISDQAVEYCEAKYD